MGNNMARMLNQQYLIIQASGDMDNDGASTEAKPKITEEQLLELSTKISDNYEPPGAMQLKKWIFSTLKIEQMADINADRYQWLIDEINKAIATRKNT